MDWKICYDKMDDFYKICCVYIKVVIMGLGLLCLVLEWVKSNNSSDFNLVFIWMIILIRMGLVELF